MPQICTDSASSRFGHRAGKSETCAGLGNASQPLDEYSGDQRPVPTLLVLVIYT